MLTWWNISNESSFVPEPFWFTQGTWESGDGYLLTFGGDNFLSSIWNLTYFYRSGQWGTVAVNGTGPPALDGPALAYDPVDGRVVMFGGYEHYTPFVYTNKTFTYSDGRWNASVLNPSPPPPTAATMAYDPDLGGVVMFAGYNNSDSTGTKLLNDLWLYKNGTWHSLPDASPPSARTWPSLAYDPGHHDLVMYGGLNAAYACFGDTWTYNGTWTKLTPGSGGPPGLYGTQMSYDPDLASLVLTGGYVCGGGKNLATWAFNGSAWQVVSTVGKPGPHLYGVISWDPVDQVLVEAGGTPNTTYTDVLSAPLRVVAHIAPTVAEVGENVSFGVSVAGGVPSRNVTWTWGDGSAGSNGTNISHTFAQAGSYPVTAEVVDRTGTQTNWQGTVTVSSGPQPQFTVSDSVLEVATNATFNASTFGGTPPISYSWDFGDGATGRGVTVEHAYASAGTFIVTLTAQDTVGSSSRSRQIVSVAPALSAAVSGASIGEVGVAAPFSVHLSGGVPGYSYNWSVDGSPESTLPQAPLSFATTGEHLVTVQVADADGATVTNSSYVLVAPAVAAQIRGPTEVSAGSDNNWTVSVTGGVSPYVETWTTSAHTNGAGASASPKFGTPGQYTLVFFVNDSANGSVAASIAITVSGSNVTTASNAISSSDLAWLGLGGALAVAIAGTALWTRRRKQS